MSFDFTVERNSPKWVLGSDGYLKEYIADAPAIEFNADGSYKGVLVEPQSINLCLQSEDINTTWIPINATPTQSTETTPDGDSTNKYIKLVDDGSTGTGSVFVRQSITVSANTTYTASVFVKADQLSFLRLRARDYDATTDGVQYFGLSGAGSLGTAENLNDSSIEVYPNGWYRCSITWTQGASNTSFIFDINVAGSISSTIVDLDGTSSIFVWGAQVEASPIATSYIPTTTGAVTRLKDDIYLTSASSLIGQTEGTLFVEVDWQEISGVSQGIIGVNDNSNNNRFLIYKAGANDTLRMFARSNSVSVTDQGESSSAYTGVQKIAFAYKTNDFELYRNGSSISTDTGGSLASLATLTNVDFGQFNDASLQANMWIRAVALFTTRLSDAEAYSLTGYDTYAQMANALQYTIL